MRGSRKRKVADMYPACLIGSRAVALIRVMVERKAARAKIEMAFGSGVRSLHGAIECLECSAADFSAADDGPGGDPFFNVNSELDMTTAQAWLGRIPK